jgi:MGT family glycosyltransferase
MGTFLVGTTALMGHVVPVAPIVAELVRRGHRVHWYTGLGCRDRVESTGAHYEPFNLASDLSEIPVNERFPNRAELTGIRSLLFDIRHLFAAETVGNVLDLQTINHRIQADAILTDTGFLAGGWLHELGGPPWAAFNPFAVNLSGRDTPAFGLGSPPAASQFGRFRVAVQQSLGGRVLYRDTTEYVDRLRARAGLSPTGQIFWDRSLSPYLYMQGSIKGLEYPRNDLPPQFHFIGPTAILARTTSFKPPEWWEDVRGRRPVILITQGTVSTNPKQLIRPTLEALASDYVLTIATTGGASAEDVATGGLPSNARIAPFIPFDQLLPHVDVMVTNGGYNGVQQALNYGVPLVVAGATEDKLEVNARVRWAGVGIDLETASPSKRAIRNAVLTVLQDDRYRQNALKLSAEFQQHNGAQVGATLMETLARTGRPVLQTARPLHEQFP